MVICTIKITFYYLEIFYFQKCFTEITANRLYKILAILVTLKGTLTNIYLQIIHKNMKELLHWLNQHNSIVISENILQVWKIWSSYHVFFGVLLDWIFVQNLCHIDCTERVSLQCVLFDVLLDYSSGKNSCYTCYTERASHQYVSSDDSQE